MTGVCGRVVLENSSSSPSFTSAHLRTHRNSDEPTHHHHCENQLTVALKFCMAVKCVRGRQTVCFNVLIYPFRQPQACTLRWSRAALSSPRVSPGPPPPLPAWPAPVSRAPQRPAERKRFRRVLDRVWCRAGTDLVVTSRNGIVSFS